MLHLPRCFNEKCLDNRDAQKKLFDMVFSPRGRRRSKQMQVIESPPDKPPRPARVVMPKGRPLADLPDEHSALEYLRQRRFDPDYLARRFGAYFCSSNRKSPAKSNPPHFFEERIVYPVFAPAVFTDDDEPDNKNRLRLVGWQARRIVDDDETPKYLTARGMRKSELLYGLPRAMTTKGPVVIVEGVTDVWRLRTNAVALFGKTISTTQCKLLLRHFQGRPIVVFLDRDAVAEAQKLYEKIRTSRIAAGDAAAVVIARLPRGRNDPDDCTYREAWASIEKAIDD